MEILIDLQIQFLSSSEFKFDPDSLNLSDTMILERFSSQLNLRCFLGTYIEEEKIITCSVRELTGPIKQIIEIARSEIEIFESLKSINYFTKPLFLSFLKVTPEQEPELVSKLAPEMTFQQDSEEIVKYSCITKKSNRTLDDILDCSVDEKINLIKQIITALFCLHQLNYYYFALSSYFISVEDDGNLVIDYMFLSNCRLLARGCSELLEFVDEELLAPEVLLLKRSFSKEVANQIDYEASEVFSLGMLIMYLFRETVDITALRFNRIAQLTYLMFILGQKRIPSLKAQNILEVREKDQFIQKIITNRINELENETIKNVCVSTLKIRQAGRFSLEMLIDIMGIEDTDQLISMNPFYAIIKDFEELVIAASSNSCPLSDLKNLLNSILERNSEMLRTAYFSYLSSKCNSNMNQGTSGILYFFYNLFRDLNDEKLLIIFRYKMVSVKIINYREHFKSIVTRDKVLQDYLIMGLFLMDIENDWEFFFSSIRIERKYYKLSSFKRMHDNFRDFLLKPSIKEILERFKNSDRNYEDLILNKVLPNVYIIDTQPSLYGLTTYGLNIFIRNYVKDDDCQQLKERGAMLIILFYEIAHLLRRISCETRQNAKNLFTPKNNSKLFIVSQEEESTERFLKGERGEAGTLAEYLLFDSTITTINDSSAEILLNHSMKDINNFRLNFFKRNKTLKETIYLGRRKNLCFSNLRCGLSGLGCSEYNLLYFNVL